MHRTKLHAIVVAACLAAHSGFAGTADTFRTLYKFKGFPDGMAPMGSLLYVQGALYGTTYLGGSGDNGCGSGCGILFKVDPHSGKETILLSFNNLDGNAPRSGMIEVNGLFYGTTLAGGRTGYGTVFAFDPKQGAESILHNFTAEPDGAFPVAGLAYHAGKLYGTTDSGGIKTSLAGCRDFNNNPVGCGTVFEVDVNTGKERVLHEFGGYADGSSPDSQLLYHRGLLYGATDYGGTSAGGAFFTVNPATGAKVLLHSIAGASEGSYPTGLIEHAGKVYGSMSEGGRWASGTLFQLDPASGALTVLYDFAGGTDGIAPTNLLYHAGALYGGTKSGGTNGYGTLFKFNLADGSKTILHNFDFKDSSAFPSAGLIYHGGRLYGVTNSGDYCCGGTVFSMKVP